MSSIDAAESRFVLYPFETLGHANHGWLNARHHFSFAGYRNTQRMQFGVLRVINDDQVAAGRGFDTHPHRDMEIITYVRQGAISHKDSLGNTGRTKAGDVQVMSAGTGVLHSEYNNENETTVLYQIWIQPSQLNVPPRWDMKTFPKVPVTDTLPLLVSGRAEDQERGALFIHQDAAIYGGRLIAGTTLTLPVKYQAYLLASEGEIRVNGYVMKKGDGAEVTHAKNVKVEAVTDSELLVIDVPALDQGAS